MAGQCVLGTGLQEDTYVHGTADRRWQCSCMDKQTQCGCVLGWCPKATDRASWLLALSCLTNASSVDASTIMSRVCLVRFELLAMMRSGTQPSEHSCWAILAASLLPCMLMGRS